MSGGARVKLRFHRPRPRAIARPLRAVLLAAAFALAGASAAVAVPYVIYYHTFGDWAVVCWKGLADGEKSCFMDAPPVAFNPDPLTSGIRVKPAGEGVAIDVSARSGTRLGTKVRLVIDGVNVHERNPDRIDHVTFTGEEAVTIIEQFRKGHSLSIELPEVGRALQLSLIGFEDAFTAFEENLDRFEPRKP